METRSVPRRPVLEVLGVFLRLGLTSFGGPVAHLGYFRAECVQRRGWLTDAAYADLVALCQFLPGPASSQAGFALGYLRAGLAGAFAAWAAFTLPSAAIMIACAYGIGAIKPGAAWLHGLKIAAVAVVAQAVWQMARKLCPDPARAGIALGATALALAFPSAWMQIVLIAAGLALGAVVFHSGAQPDGDRLPLRDGPLPRACLILFFALLASLPIVASITQNRWLVLADGFYRTGSLVFGGGHVVLPLIETETVGRGWVTRGDFLAGYGAAQALPGPLFSIAAYLGALSLPAGPRWLAGLWCLFAILLPSFLLVLGVLPHWQQLRSRPAARGALTGANAIVVGLLLAALYHPVGTSAITSWRAALIAASAIAALQFAKLPQCLLVPVCALAGGLLLRA
ncbi:MAG: chromate efflux transporter [Terrimicrobiaceae bacterium]|nr:chromate efflux transporter [Terrimicrobiaceae bacterium]